MNNLSKKTISLETKEQKTSLEHEIHMNIKNAQRRIREGLKPKVTTLVKDYSEFDEDNPKGKPIGICKKCGKEFEQDFSKDRNAYSSFRTCKECRHKKSVKQAEKVGLGTEEFAVTVGVIPYNPYPWQIEAEQAFNEHRFIVLACGNRCFPSGQFINGCDEFVENITENDSVINQNGDFQDIIQIQKIPYCGDMFTIKCFGSNPITLTEHHKVLVFTFEVCTHRVVSDRKSVV